MTTNSTQSPSELLPCPFCGQVPTEFRHTDGPKWGAVVCCIAGPEVRTGYRPLGDWRAEAITAWNTRQKEAKPADALVDAADFLRDLAERIFMNCTPAMGFDQGDTDRLAEIAKALKEQENES